LITDPAGIDRDLNHAGGYGANAFSKPLGPWTEYYPVDGCEDPALLYFLAQNAISEVSDLAYESIDIEDHSSTLRLANRLQEDPQWAGLAHSIKGDFYYWSSAYTLERTMLPRPFSHQRYLKQALWEYKSALRLQPDDPGIRHGKALVHLEQGKAKKKGAVNKTALNAAIEEVKTALQVAPSSPRLSQTLIEAHEEKGDYETAARLQREFLSAERPTPKPLTLVPFSPISHGADLYSDLRLYESAGGGAFVDEEVITPFVPQLYIFSYGSGRGWNPLYHISQYRSGLQYFSLVSNDLFSGNYAAFERDLRQAPEPVKNAFTRDLQEDPEAAKHASTMRLMIGIKQLLAQPEAMSTPTAQTQSAINDYIAVHLTIAQGGIAKAMLEDKSVFEEIRLTDYLTDYPSLTDYYGLLKDTNEVVISPDDELRFPQNSYFYWEAANFLRQHKQYDKALRIYRIWEEELKRDGVGKERRAEVEKLMGEALFLQGSAEEAVGSQEQARNKYEEALSAFDQAVGLRPDWPPYVVRQAFMLEKLEDYAKAEELYRNSLEAMKQQAEWMNPEQLEAMRPEDFYSPFNYHTTKHLGDVLLREAENAKQTTEEDDATEHQDKYEEAAREYRRALTTGTVPSKSAAVSNLGVALLRAGYYTRSIEVLETLVQPPATVGDPKTACTQFWKAVGGSVQVECDEYSTLPGTTDAHNPVFHLNLGWAYELNEQPEKAKEQYLSAVKSDPSFFPALNDLGAMAVKDGDLGEAKGYFEAALKAKPDYAYAAHNLGVALLESGGIGNFLAAQHYLAHAVSYDASLAETSYDYIFDHELYFLNLSLGTSVPADWKFAAHAERSNLVLSVVVVALLLWGIIRRTAYEKGRETLVDKMFGFGKERYGSSLSRVWTRVRNGWLRFSRLGRPRRAPWWMTPLALAVTAPAVAAVEGWSLLWETSAVKLTVVVTLVYLALVSLLVHHAGHAIVALRNRLQVREAPWPAGIAQAIALVAASGAFVAPMPATSVEGETDKRRHESVLLAGPLASILFALLLYVLYVSTHIPLFNFGAVLNLGLAAASLLALPPLEGATISEGYYTRWTFWIAIFVTVMSAILAANSFF
jgi:tetratricopeptide (TPR) repeat protein/Zn-dependent protease